MESPGAYIKQTVDTSLRDSYMILSTELLLPIEMAKHIESSGSVTAWLQTAIARQIENDLKTGVEKA